MSFNRPQSVLFFFFLQIICVIPVKNLHSSAINFKNFDLLHGRENNGRELREATRRYIAPDNLQAI